MSTSFENKDRKVIPNFRSLNKTIALGELNVSQVDKEAFGDASLDEYIKEYKENPEEIFASELVSAAVVNNKLEEKEVIAAANFLTKSKTSSVAQLRLANKILGVDPLVIQSRNINSIDEFLESNSLPLIYARLKALKKEVSMFNRNPFLYSELARIYSIIGQRENAIKNMVIAKQLAPSNRYILRSFARLMTHFNELDQAHDALRKNNLTKFDPWLLASEISIAALNKKSSSFIKAGREVLTSKQFSNFSLSELASSLATIELAEGSRKKSKELFRTALIAPNDNTLAQVEWANSKEDFFDMDVKNFRVENNSEAITLDSFNSEDWENTVKHAEQWFVDMPFAKRPVMFGHHTASFHLEDQQTAIKFCKAGLIANPTDPIIINNIAYSYAMLNDPDSSFSYLNRIKLSDVSDAKDKICLLATTGLAFYKTNDLEQGKQFYYDAMDLAKETKNIRHFALAFMNFAREEVAAKSAESSSYYTQAMDIKTDGTNKDIEIMKKRLKALHSSVK